MKRRGQSTLKERLRYVNKAYRKSGPVEVVQTWMQLPRGNKIALPSRFGHEDIRCADSLVEYCVNEFSQAGEVVFDPFAGFGTTLMIAEELGRQGYGIEYSKGKADYVRKLLERPERLIHGDSRKLLEYDLPLIDLCFTSPPYTNRSDTENPFVDYRQKGFDYPSYLQEMGSIFSQVAQKMKPSGRLVIEASNLKKDGEVTTLAWDIAREVSRIFHFDGETVICWEEYGYGYNHSYCLVFSKP
ncbi:MAG: DNA methylase [Anaerolineales bacterium]|nr:site-specific DNA-methyltransferase [Anaerolineae bacterium]PWB76028.1 MAG: DNA methylase [Anaerolineales bacterium]